MEPSKEHDARMSALVGFFRFLVEEVEEDKLLLLGCRRTKEKDGFGGKVVRVCYNQRRMSIVDAEHAACKLSILISKAVGSRAYSLLRASATHCHPSKSDDLTPKSMENIMSWLYVVTPFETWKDSFTS